MIFLDNIITTGGPEQQGNSQPLIGRFSAIDEYGSIEIANKLVGKGGIGYVFEGQSQLGRVAIKTVPVALHMSDLDALYPGVIGERDVADINFLDHHPLDLNTFSQVMSIDETGSLVNINDIGGVLSLNSSGIEVREEGITRILREAYAGIDSTEAISGQSRHIVSAKQLRFHKFNHYGREYAQPVIVMEHVDGYNLNTIIKGNFVDRPSYISAAEASTCGLELALARHYTNEFRGLSRELDYSNGIIGSGSREEIIHRDIKPSNVMISDLGWVRLIDYGLAISGRKTLGKAFGTPTYVAPEMVVSSSGAVPQSDQFGSVASYLSLLANLGGSSEYYPLARKGNSPMEMAISAISSPFEDDADLKPDFVQVLQTNLNIGPVAAGALEQVAKVALKRKPKDRFTHSGIPFALFDAVLQSIQKIEVADNKFAFEIPTDSIIADICAYALPNPLRKGSVQAKLDIIKKLESGEARHVGDAEFLVQLFTEQNLLPEGLNSLKESLEFILYRISKREVHKMKLPRPTAQQRVVFGDMDMTPTGVVDEGGDSEESEIEIPAIGEENTGTTIIDEGLLRGVIKIVKNVLRWRKKN